MGSNHPDIDTPGSNFICQLVGKMDVCQLTHSICFPFAVPSFPVDVIEPDLPNFMCSTGYIHNSRSLCPLEQVKQMSCEGKMAQVVHSELHLKILHCTAQRDGHQSGIIDQQVQLLI